MICCIRAGIAKLANKIAALRRHSEFTCGDCERVERCGLPPSEDCLIRIEQLSREDRYLGERARSLSPW
jgi:hypothetical protein